ncbi:MAG: hypothetical protein GWM90_07655, partial [Gemmatimonadetes bacterium]|nr:hypothetical protein [Gemmatimonadota bacterium]NIQ53744.1 hypothetical protein [Gemmatimonadota bacterium]NIU73917.1 hypothetical protein [Gammaproteobacteria bacterium]NIX43988.1 hypothetical protein [Gemmatimonadota bacterium]NIY08201.1 hypothetical protein [Gemmatimonadota bacterium]
MGCRPTGVLRDEHRLILRVVAALEAFVESDPASGSPDDARAFVEFFSLYTDALHHGKEEDHLFDTLVEHGFPRHQGPIAMMLQEHELGRALVRQMAAAIGPAGPRHRPVAGAAGPGSLLRRSPPTPHPEGGRRAVRHGRRVPRRARVPEALRRVRRGLRRPLRRTHVGAARGPGGSADRSLRLTRT